MTIYVLDASALIRFVDGEGGAARIRQILSECAARRAGVCVSALQWGEVAGNMRKRFGESIEASILSTLLPSEANIVSATADRAVHAANLKADRKISYADAFALDLASDSPDHVLVTADYDFKDVEDLAHIEFLPAK